MTVRLRSLQSRLVLRLGLVLAAAFIVMAGTLAHYAIATADNVDDASLQVQAQQILRHLEFDADGTARLKLPGPLQTVYQDPEEALLYLLRRSDGEVLLASGTKARTFLQGIEPAGEHSFVRLPGTGPYPYYAYAVHTGRPAVPLVLIVAQGRTHDDVFIDSLIGEFAEHIGWTFAAVLLLTLLIAAWTIRTGLAPLHRLSARTAHIDPRNTDVRLPLKDVPSEILPLVRAVNDALDRLAQGFAAQREFTANAAHELRTPLTVLSARLEELGDAAPIGALREDARHMSRLVDQLLDVARLDSGAVGPSQPVDLAELARDLVSYMAPLAIRRGRRLALLGAERTNVVPGDRAALRDAVRNLVENALVHAPAGSEVEVDVGESGQVTVRDHGPGVPPNLREEIFQRFRRGSQAKGPGAGLGLAIAAGVAHAHGGHITVTDAPGGGAAFTITLPAH